MLSTNSHILMLTLRCALNLFYYRNYRKWLYSSICTFKKCCHISAIQKELLNVKKLKWLNHSQVLHIPLQIHRNFINLWCWSKRFMDTLCAKYPRSEITFKDIRIMKLMIWLFALGFDWMMPDALARRVVYSGLINPLCGLCVFEGQGSSRTAQH